MMPFSVFAEAYSGRPTEKLPDHPHPMVSSVWYLGHEAWTITREYQQQLTHRSMLLSDWSFLHLRADGATKSKQSRHSMDESDITDVWRGCKWSADNIFYLLTLKDTS